MPTSAEDSYSFESFTGFERLPNGNPLLALEPPLWAAAAHALALDDTIHYLWAWRREDNHWELMHSTARTSDPCAVQHDPRNPVFVPSDEGFDDFATEYPFPFVNPADGKLYAYYLARRKPLPKQTGLLVSDGDWGHWTRVGDGPVIPVEAEFEAEGSSHPSVAIDGDTIHIVYTGESSGPPVICHATAPTGHPAAVTKDPANPVFRGTGQAWDSGGVREAEILKGPDGFHIFYGGSDGQVWRIGHVRTRDFRTFEPSSYNPIFDVSPDPDAWDCDGILTPQMFQVGGRWHMIYAGKKGKEWQSGLAAAPVS